MTSQEANQQSLMGSIIALAIIAGGFWWLTENTHLMDGVLGVAATVVDSEESVVGKACEGSFHPAKDASLKTVVKPTPYAKIYVVHIDLKGKSPLTGEPETGWVECNVTMGEYGYAHVTEARGTRKGELWIE